jgi:hypothetical protein
MIENGAYNENWYDIHMFPNESVQAHIDLKGVTMLPIHNSTFDLSFHTWYDPLDHVSVGEVFSVEQAPITKQWWRDYK